MVAVGLTKQFLSRVLQLALVRRRRYGKFSTLVKEAYLAVSPAPAIENPASVTSSRSSPPTFRHLTR
jgi:hypothetical protein